MLGLALLKWIFSGGIRQHCEDHICFFFFLRGDFCLQRGIDTDFLEVSCVLCFLLGFEVIQPKLINN